MVSSESAALAPAYSSRGISWVENVVIWSSARMSSKPSNEIPHSVPFLTVGTSFLRCLRVSIEPGPSVSEVFHIFDHCQICQFHVDSPSNTGVLSGPLRTLTLSVRVILPLDTLHPATLTLVLPFVTSNTCKTLASPMTRYSILGGSSAAVF